VTARSLSNGNDNRINELESWPRGLSASKWQKGRGFRLLAIHIGPPSKGSLHGHELNKGYCTTIKTMGTGSRGGRQPVG